MRSLNISITGSIRGRAQDVLDDRLPDGGIEIVRPAGSAADRAQVSARQAAQDHARRQHEQERLPLGTRTFKRTVFGKEQCLRRCRDGTALRQADPDDRAAGSGHPAAGYSAWNFACRTGLVTVHHSGL